MKSFFTELLGGNELLGIRRYLHRCAGLSSAAWSWVGILSLATTYVATAHSLVCSLKVILLPTWVHSLRCVLLVILSEFRNSFHEQEAVVTLPHSENSSQSLKSRSLALLKESSVFRSTMPCCDYSWLNLQLMWLLHVTYQALCTLHPSTRKPHPLHPSEESHKNCFMKKSCDPIPRDEQLSLLTQYLHEYMPRWPHHWIPVHFRTLNRKIVSLSKVRAAGSCVSSLNFCYSTPFSYLPWWQLTDTLNPALLPIEYTRSELLNKSRSPK